MDKFLGVPYPITKDARGYFRSQGGLAQIKSDLLILLLTNPGERVMLPEYGTGLRQLLFEPNDASLRSQAKQLIIAAIQQWEPRIAIDQIDVFADVDTQSISSQQSEEDLGGILMIRITFKDPEDMQTIDQLVLEVPLGGVS